MGVVKATFVSPPATVFVMCAAEGNLLCNLVLLTISDIISAPEP